MPERIATWNPARGVWETENADPHCGHSAPYSATWPVSGSMRSGSAFRRPAWTPRTSESEPSSLRGPLMPTPTSSDGTGGPGVTPKRTGGMNLRTAVTLLPAPVASP